MPNVIELGASRRDILGSWSAEAVIASGLRVSVLYVSGSEADDQGRVEAAMREAVERVSQGEADYRLRAARAWLDTFHRERRETRGWDAERLARTFTLRGLLLGPSDPSIVVEHATTVPVDKVLKTWFNPDGSLSHISGGLD